MTRRALRSCGEGKLVRRRAEGKLRNLEHSLRAEPVEGAFGVGHTRWATHGRPSEENAHPHQDCHGQIVVVHNGIIENYLALEGAPDGCRSPFRDPDRHRGDRPPRRVALRRLCSSAPCVRPSPSSRGSTLWSSFTKTSPITLVGARMGPPMVVGLGDGERFLASDVPALLSYTRDFMFLDDGDVVTVTPDTARVDRCRWGRGRPASRSGSPGTRSRSRRAAIATSCSRRSTSSPAPSATRCSAGSASTTALFTSRSSAKRRTGYARPSAWCCSPAAPAGTPPWWASSSSSSSPASPRRSTTAASSAIARRWSGRRRWRSRSARAARRPTRWQRFVKPSAAGPCPSPSATFRAPCSRARPPARC